MFELRPNFDRTPVAVERREITGRCDVRQLQYHEATGRRIDRPVHLGRATFAKDSLHQRTGQSSSG
jgi:hypothetical protein